MVQTYRAAILIIGNEILSGRTQDTNTSWIATKLSERGIELFEVRVVPDIEDRIITAVNELRGRVDYLFTTGGIGPTHDDITSATMAKLFQRDLALNPQARTMLLNHYKAESELTPARLRMAHIPQGARLIPNPISGAPGFQIENVYVMAGVPSIMKCMLDHILPELKGGDPILCNSVTFDLAESVIAEELGELQKIHPQVSIGSYPYLRAGEVGVSIVLRSPDNDPLHRASLDVINMIERSGGKIHAASLQSAGPRT
ncbi:MAG: competence/damage-inducible protein A [Alphaproteobacteria bacterium]|nr:competence/damage-inducible protein A [Alphaproteobacteria bacterium]